MIRVLRCLTLLDVYFINACATTCIGSGIGLHKGITDQAFNLDSFGWHIGESIGSTAIGGILGLVFGVLAPISYPLTAVLWFTRPKNK